MEAGFRIACKANRFSISRIFEEAGEAGGATTKGAKRTIKMKIGRNPVAMGGRLNVNRTITAISSIAKNSLRVCLPLTCASS